MQKLPTFLLDKRLPSALSLSSENIGNREVVLKPVIPRA